MMITDNNSNGSNGEQLENLAVMLTVWESKGPCL